MSGYASAVELHRKARRAICGLFASPPPMSIRFVIQVSQPGELTWK